ncbi:unnamed protein product [Rhizoctonia solani]|nr:unnamed protein product [Rhizoctonia solani]
MRLTVSAYETPGRGFGEPPQPRSSEDGPEAPDREYGSWVGGPNRMSRLSRVAATCLASHLRANSLSCDGASEVVQPSTGVAWEPHLLKLYSPNPIQKAATYGAADALIIITTPPYSGDCATKLVGPPRMSLALTPCYPSFIREILKVWIRPPDPEAIPPVVVTRTHGSGMQYSIL